ncbi:hypothetical protein TNIN_443751 [Trichonephila inaurata madagascariensis]|uniref:Uncharacterized protein n=1 Tax=Trichonephila inaurata madagascariensis TaxID=2747483 RepID=A0A8X6I7B2_9ARAC|nr:hypothetical protein TNIN_443751 [Trichonephila inaurata madagascariensis]
MVWQEESDRTIRESLSYKTRTIPPLDDPPLPHEERTCPLEWVPRNADIPANGGSRTGAAQKGRGVKGSSHPLQSSCHDFGGGQFFCWQQPRPIHQVGRTMDNKQWPGEEGFSVAFGF